MFIKCMVIELMLGGLCYMQSLLWGCQAANPIGQHITTSRLVCDIGIPHRLDHDKLCLSETVILVGV